MHLVLGVPGKELDSIEFLPTRPAETGHIVSFVLSMGFETLSAKAHVSCLTPGGQLCICMLLAIWILSSLNCQVWWNRTFDPAGIRRLLQKSS